MRLAHTWLALALVWLLLIVLTPYLADADLPRERDASPSPRVRAAAGSYLVGSLMCHQRPERSFHVRQLQLPVCARCFGVYAGAPIGAAVAIWAGRFGHRRVDRLRRLLWLAAPTLATLALEWSGAAYPSNLVRAVAALPLGLAVAWLIADGLVRLRPDASRARDRRVRL